MTGAEPGAGRGRDRCSFVCTPKNHFKFAADMRTCGLQGEPNEMLRHRCLPQRSYVPTIGAPNWHHSCAALRPYSANRPSNPQSGATNTKPALNFVLGAPRFVFLFFVFFPFTNAVKAGKSDLWSGELKSGLVNGLRFQVAWIPLRRFGFAFWRRARAKGKPEGKPAARSVCVGLLPPTL